MSIFAGSLDANVILRLLLNDLPRQHEAAVKLLQSTKQPYAAADTAIIEIAFVLERHYQFTRLQIQEALSGFMSIPQINCNRTLFTQALPLFVAHTGLSFEDCCLAVYARLNDAEPLWTFDKKLANQVSEAALVKS